MADYTNQIAYFLGAGDACSCTCPLQDDTICNSQLNGGALCGYDYQNKAKYVHDETVRGAVTHLYNYVDDLGPIPMAEHDLWLSAATLQPVRFRIVSEPFGKWIGNITSDYTNFSTQEPDAKLFAVTGKSTCQQCDEADCQNL